MSHLRKVVSYDIGERRNVQDEENGPQYCDGDEDELLTEVD